MKFDEKCYTIKKNITAYASVFALPAEERGVKPLPIRYFIINGQTDVMHIHGFCQQTKPRKVPIRLFDTVQELTQYAGRPLRMCVACQKAREMLDK